VKVILFGLLLVTCIVAGMTATPPAFSTTQLANNYLPIVTSQTSNYWKPLPGTSWQIQFSGDLDTSLNVQMYDVDLFETSQQSIDQLHSRNRRVVCYFSAGSWEDWRPDSGKFLPEVLGADLSGWPGEKWLDIRRLDLLGSIMTARLNLAKQKSCDGVDPDNVDGYTNQSGFPLTSNDQLTYNIWIAEQAHARELAVGLKNDLDQTPTLITYYDWAINEQCFQYNECELLLPFIQAGKPVFGIEYQGDPASICSKSNAMNFDFLMKHLDLDEWRLACR
jgi:hypothetical protein